jgi:plastocyanin
MRRVGMALVVATCLIGARRWHGNDTAKVHAASVTVQMIGSSNGYMFKPSTITIKVGDEIKFVNVSGGPHNVTFDENGIPAGMKDVLTKNMPGTMAPLTGPLLTTENQTYTVSFAGAKPGAYRFYCLPHQSLNMQGSVIVQ